MARPDTSQLQSLLNPSRTVGIILPQTPHHDTVAAGLALKLTLETAQKTVTVICADKMTVEHNTLVGVDSVTDSFGSDSLIISFHDQTELVDKVSYDLEKGDLRLVITPKAGAAPLDHRRLKFVPSTGKKDVYVLVGVSNLKDLGPLFEDSKKQFANSQIVTITKQMPSENFAAHHLYDPEASALSELMAHVIDAAGWQLHQDVATNLYSGLIQGTQNFQKPEVTARTFEIASLLMRRGAQRHQAAQAKDFPEGSIPTKPYHEETVAQPKTSSINLGYGTDSAKSEDVPPAEDKEVDSNDAPSEWFEPKIYRGPMLQ